MTHTCVLCGEATENPVVNYTGKPICWACSKSILRMMAGRIV